jgi:hypothetical protein
MGMDLPHDLAGLLNDLGFFWPEIDETKLAGVGDLWSDLGGRLEDHVGEAHHHASLVWAQNSGDDIAAFQAAWTHHESPSTVLGDGTVGAQVLAVGLVVGAAIVLGLKVYVVVQLVILLAEIIEAIATGPPTLGASLLEIPVFKKISGMVLNLVFNKSTAALLA